MRLIQFSDDDGVPRVGIVDADGHTVRILDGVPDSYVLAREAISAGITLEARAAAAGGERRVDYAALRESGRLLTPLAHPDPAHCLVSGTGLTHYGSASTRDAMHRKLADSSEAALTDTMRMFRLGIEAGIPKDGAPGAQPEWFYKGDGSIVVPPGAAFESPAFALDAGEEPELVGLYLIGDDARPYRLGFAIGNEFSDHVTERQNYLYLAHSKLRQCAVGPELLSGPLPAHLEGSSRVWRGDSLRWEKPFLTGEANMCHTLANLEFHHFKYAAHRRPGDVHLHFFGTATLSFADGLRVEPGDVFEIDLPALGAPLRNPLRQVDTGFSLGGVQAL